MSPFSSSINKNSLLARILGMPGCSTIRGSVPSSPIMGATIEPLSGKVPSLPVIGRAYPLSSITLPSERVIGSIGRTPFTA